MTKDTYFEKCSLLEYLMIISGFAILIFLVVHPEPHFYLGSLGVPGEALFYLHENYYRELYYIMIIASAIHVLETLYCIKVAIGLNMKGYTIAKWTFQTFLLGGFSLIKIGNYKKLTADKTT